MAEKWKWIKGFEGLYKISNKGRIKSYHKQEEGYIMSSKNSNWYESITLFKKGKSFYKRIHRLVAKEFIPNPKNKPQVNHKDMDKHNNCVENLEWVTASENSKHAAKNKPSMIAGMIEYNKDKKTKLILQIDLDTGKVINEFINGAEASKKTGVCQRNILQVANKKEFSPGRIRKQAGGYKWVFKEEYNNEDNSTSVGFERQQLFNTN